MARDTTDSRPIEDVGELVAYLAAGNKPRDKWRIGTEHEKFPFYIDGNAPVPYGGERGIRGVELDLSDATYLKFKAGGIPYSATLPAPPDIKAVKIVVYDYVADLVGSLVLPIR